MTAFCDDFALPDHLVELGAGDALALDLRYATMNNFLARNIYGSFDRLFLHPIAATKLRAAAARLHAMRPDLSLRVWDGFRPNRVQRVLWDMVRGTEQQKFVADPAVGSVHGYGFAVDLTLVARGGHDLDMGTDFDDFSALAEPRLEQELLASGLLTRTQVGNRLLLRDVMVGAGFLPLSIEWWHFDALPPAEVRTLHQLIE